MREILFRGKAVRSGKWREGNLLTDLNGNVAIAEITSDGICAYAEMVIPETVGQYTGIDDTNGNKIFIGDLLQTEHNSLQRPQEEVFRVRELDVGGYVVENKNDFGYLYNHNDNSKVIGNIHDNPELLEEE